MSYPECLRAAGATVHRDMTFGSYQGEWITEVTLPDGRHGFIKAAYGSCSGCDAYEAELGSDYHTCDGAESYLDKRPDTCTKCREYEEKRRAFRTNYFSELVSREELLQAIAADCHGSVSELSDEFEMVAWVMGWPEDGSEVRAFFAMQGVVIT